MAETTNVTKRTNRMVKNRIVMTMPETLLEGNAPRVKTAPDSFGAS